jgi:translocation and assembly module TamA
MVFRPNNMASICNINRTLLARKLYAILAFALLTIGSLQAQTQTSATTLTLSAPKPLQALLMSYINLPATLLDETARATFMHRVRQEIGELLASEGYFTPTVTLHPAGTDGRQLVEVIAGPRTLVSQLNIKFSGDLANTEQRDRIERLRSAWELAIGAPFRSSDWEQAKSALLASVAQADYAAAQLSASEAEIDPVTASARLTVVIDSGPAFHFGDLEITGLERYDKNMVLRQSPFHTGDPYRRSLLLTLQTRLQNMPQFSSVIVNLSPDAATHQAAPVQVVMTEAKTRRVAVGVGFSSNNGARSEINYLNHNFLGRALNFTSMLRLEQKRQTVSFGIDTQPDDNGYLLSWGVGSEATQIEGLKTVRNKLGVTRRRTRGEIETQTGIHWQQENLQPTGGIQKTTQALVPDWQWHHRAVDDLLYPRLGTVTELRLGGGSRHLMSSQDFLRSYARHQIWWPIGEHDSLSLRGEAGITTAPSRLGIPQEYLFRAGGSQSVRGYAYQSLGVRDAAAIVGGRAMVTGSIEYIHWLNHEWGAAVFTDTGGVSDIMRTLRLSTGYGGGVRWRSPVGPLALDLARGHALQALQLHFSLSVAL